MYGIYYAGSDTFPVDHRRNVNNMGRFGDHFTHAFNVRAAISEEIVFSDTTQKNRDGVRVV